LHVWRLSTVEVSKQVESVEDGVLLLSRGGNIEHKSEEVHTKEMGEMVIM
jgi:hypothetical protein